MSLNESESETFIKHDIIGSVLDDWFYALKKKKKVKVGTHAETNFDCPNPECKAVLTRYRTLFDHFASASCQPKDWEKFGWWCNECEMPRFWLNGTDLVRHKQDYHGIDNFPEMLSWKVKPDGFQEDELLEFNVKDFGFLWQKRHWGAEVAKFKDTGIHEVIFKHPARKPETLRKRKVKSKKGVSSDILEAGGGDIVGDVPIDLSVSSTAGGSCPKSSMSMRVMLLCLRKISTSLTS